MMRVVNTTKASLLDLFYREKKLKTFFSMEEYDYLENVFATKVNNIASWGVYTFLLSAVKSKGNSTKQVMKNAFYIELFIIATDFVDDYMDRDNPEFSQLDNPKMLTFNLLRFALNNLSKCIPTRFFNAFLKHLASSLNYQSLESKSRLFLSSEEDTYFRYNILRSVYLVHAISEIVLLESKKDLFRFSYMWAGFNQIQNDIRNILSEHSSDLISKKPTLPIVRAFEDIDQTDEIYPLYFSYINDHEFHEFKRLQVFIENSGSIEYATMLSKICFQRAMKYLHAVYPNSENNILQLERYFTERC